MKKGKEGIYAKYIKRLLDLILALLALIILSPILLLFSLIGVFFMKGNPFFTQQRPGRNEKIFKLIKFRTMSNAKDKNGNLLPDEKRLNKYGMFLRSTSIDELPELINIAKGDMAIVGPRPQLIRDMMFMSSEQRKRHTIRPGLSGWAQVNGRNSINWEDKLKYDLEYIARIGFLFDLKIILLTIIRVFKANDISSEGMATAEDFGDYLLRTGKITEQEYATKMKISGRIAKENA